MPERRDGTAPSPQIVDGVLVIDKPAGITSHDVVAVARRCLRESRIGHTGTLDPLATGVLPLACGRATRLVRFLMASTKDYDAEVQFGLTTDSYDISGTATARSDARPAADAIERALASLRGSYEQTPPAFSAKKVAGRRAYAMARQQQDVVLAAVPVRVTRAELTALGEDGRGRFAISCSSGFYVRTFAHVLGQLVGTGACLSALRRTRSGRFGLRDAVTLGDLQASPEAALAALRPMRELLPSMAAVCVTDEGRLRVTHGRAIEPRHVASTRPGDEPGGDAGGDADVEGWVQVLDRSGELLAVARSAHDGNVLHPSVVLI